MERPEIVALNPGFPGAGRVLQELGTVFRKNVMYCRPEYFQGRSIGWAPPTQAGEYVFLPAWRPDYLKVDGLGKPVIVWTSPLLQSELVPQELEYIEEILHALDSGKIWGVWCGDKGARALFRNRARVFYAPYPVSVPSWFKKAYNFPIANVSLFGPLHPRKNVLAQALAARELGVQLHITDDSAVPIMRITGVNFKAHGWLPYPSYASLLESIDVGLQASAPGVESFSYVAWDHISRGIPCLTSVKWAPEPLQARDPFDPDEIVRQIRELPFPLPDLRAWAKRFAEKRNEECRKQLEMWLGISLA